MATDVLAEIVAHKKTEIERSKSETPISDLKDRLRDAIPVRDFLQALREGEKIGLIAEVKKASPSAGLIRPDFDPVEIARLYESAGAHCISCLTDERYFQGRLSYLTGIKDRVSLPVMRKDFLIDPYQVYEARAAGADCVLLIAECLDDPTLRELFLLAHELGMEALIEIHDPENLPRVLELAPPLLGINNRNLKTMVTDLDQTIRLARAIPRETLLVSESGIKTREDVARLQAAGAGAILVGETLMRESDLAGKIEELLG